MPNKKIKELNSLNQIAASDAVAIQSGNTTFHTTVSALQNHMLEDVLARLDALENQPASSDLGGPLVNVYSILLKKDLHSKREFVKALYGGGEILNITIEQPDYTVEFFNVTERASDLTGSNRDKAGDLAGWGGFASGGSQALGGLGPNAGKMKFTAKRDIHIHLIYLSYTAAGTSDPVADFRPPESNGYDIFPRGLWWKIVKAGESVTINNNNAGDKTRKGTPWFYSIQHM